jgi:acyl-CoA reductase-like NAD-dependent aldehyde dehydrogenase
LVEQSSENLSMNIAREGGKPLTAARIETKRAINGIQVRLGRSSILPATRLMGLTPASENLLVFTTREPIGVVVAISAFNHPLNPVVHQVVPAMACGPLVIRGEVIHGQSAFARLPREGGRAEC